MDLLLDTHAFLWWLSGDRRLSPKARQAIIGTVDRIFVSAASAWEITTKFRIGKLQEAAAFAGRLHEVMEREDFQTLPVSFHHGQMAGAFPGHHNDPFDRMLIAQAMADDLTLVSNEQRFDAYGVRRLW